jgi:putative transposase
VIGLYKAECVRRDGPLRTVEDLELVTSSWVHWFNTCRLHSMIGHRPPAEYEQSYYAANQPEKIRSRDNPASTEVGALHSPSR